MEHGRRAGVQSGQPAASGARAARRRPDWTAPDSLDGERARNHLLGGGAGWRQPERESAASRSHASRSSTVQRRSHGDLQDRGTLRRGSVWQGLCSGGGLASRDTNRPHVRNRSFEAEFRGQADLEPQSAGSLQRSGAAGGTPPERSWIRRRFPGGGRRRFHTSRNPATRFC